METQIPFPEVKRRLLRSQRFTVLYRILCLICLLGAPVIQTTFHLSRKIYFFVVIVIALLGWVGVILNSDSLCVCANCHAKFKRKTLLSVSEDKWDCPHCGAPFRAKVDRESFPF